MVGMGLQKESYGRRWLLEKRLILGLGRWHYLTIPRTAFKHYLVRKTALSSLSLRVRIERLSSAIAAKVCKTNQTSDHQALTLNLFSLLIT